MYAGDKDGVTFKVKGGKAVHFPLVGKLGRQYRYRPEANGRVVDTTCTVIAPGQAKALTTPTDMDTFHCTYGHTHKVLLEKMAEQQEVNPHPELFNDEGATEPIARSTHTRVGTLCPSRAPAATAPYSRRGVVYSWKGREQKGASNQGGERIEDLGSESDLDNMTKVWPPVPPATRKAIAAEPGAGATGVRKATPRHHRSPREGRFLRHQRQH